MTAVKILNSLTADELLRELRARERFEQNSSLLGADDTPAPELNEALRGIDSATIVESLREMQKVVYGADDRRDLFQVRDNAVLDASRGVVALVEANSIRDNGDGTSTLITETFGVRQRLCSFEPFRDQPVAAFCSGFLVAPDVIATAGHCVTASNVRNIRFVFGFRMIDARQARTVVGNDEIFRGIRVIDRRQEGGGSDWALVQLDRPAPADRVLPIRRGTGRINDGQQLYVIGHPSGLPAKFADGAQVRANSEPAFFVANLDTYGGNSGSPVFNSDTNEVEGVLVRGETDFVSQGSCRVSLVCPVGSDCRGEDCTRVSEFARLIPDR